MTKINHPKFDNLVNQLKKLEKVAIAFLGSVDSDLIGNRMVSFNETIHS